MLNAPHRNYRLEAFLCKRDCVGEKAWGEWLKQKTRVKSENKKFKQVGLQWWPQDVGKSIFDAVRCKSPCIPI